MKTLFTLLLLSFFIQDSDAARSCNRTKGLYLCKNDTVISQTGFVGEVIGVNPHTEKIAVRWHTNPQGYARDFRETSRIRDLAIGRGCLGYFCVGDRVVSESGFVGKVIGLNPYLSKAAVKWHTNPRGYARDFRELVNLKRLAIGRGCVYGLCEQDGVISPTGFVGRVIGVNPYTYQAAVKWHTSPRGYARDFREIIAIEELAIEDYCTKYSSEVRSPTISISFRGKVKIDGFKFRFMSKN